MSVVTKLEMPIPATYQGKVRDAYDLGDRLLFVATDRISAFDVILPCGIPDKGFVLNQISAFWFKETASLIPNHMIELVDDKKKLANIIPGKVLPETLLGRSMIVSKAKRLPVEAVVRGYLSGSAWEEYKNKGTISGKKVAAGLKESDKLPEPLFTPTTKADAGHDMPMTDAETADLLGKEIASVIKEKSIAIYSHAMEYAAGRGIIIADTKFEFGFINDSLALIDELLTPDSSRFWDKKSYSPGKSQPSFDKQPVRDWLAQSGWNKEPPAPMLPDDVIKQTSERYKAAYKIITGKDISR
jgi:phosphoribosylaminoimidazole-succinocarboxamide synthase